MRLDDAMNGQIIGYKIGKLCDYIKELDFEVTNWVPIIISKPMNLIGYDIHIMPKIEPANGYEIIIKPVREGREK